MREKKDTNLDKDLGVAVLDFGGELSEALDVLDDDLRRFFDGVLALEKGCDLRLELELH